MANSARSMQQLPRQEIVSESEPFLRPVSTDIENLSNTLKLPESQNGTLSLENLSDGQSGLPHERHPRYAKKEFLSKYIPETDPDHERAKTIRTRMSKRSVMLNVQTVLATSIAIVNLALTSWAYLRQRRSGGGESVFIGSCSSASRIDTYVHLLLNVISTLFLGAGNYCMQILSAPSREEAVKSHTNGRSLDIGIPSIRNLFSIERTRTVLWTLIGAAATILHLFWNSAFYASIPFVVFPAAAVTSDFLLATDDWSLSNPITDPTIIANRSSIYDLHERAKNFTRLDNRQCIDQYIDPLKATSELVLVSNRTTVENNGSSLIHGWISGSDSVQWDGATYWICSEWEGSSNWWTYCAKDEAEKHADDWIVLGNTIEYCLVGEQGDNANVGNLGYGMSDDHVF